MRRSALIACLLTALAARAAHGQGFDVTYGDGCWQETPSSLLTFACDANTGAMVFTVSCVFGTPMSDFIGFDVLVAGAGASGSMLPDWWQLYNAGACRSSSLTVSGDFTSSPQTACVDPFSGLAVGGVTSYEVGQYTLGEGFRLRASYRIEGTAPLEAAVPYYVMRARVNYAKTVGTDACAGCAMPITIGPLSVAAIGQSGSKRSVGWWNQNGCLGWQGPAGRCLPTPARNTTWGQVKSLYR